MFDTTKEQAIREARRVRNLLPGKIWRTRVWNDCGWCWSVNTENLYVHGSCYNGKWTYGCLVGTNGGGCGFWTTRRYHSHTSPKAAVKAALEFADMVMKYHGNTLKNAQKQSGLYLPKKGK